jgi:hypothetical protein
MIAFGAAVTTVGIIEHGEAPAGVALTANFWFDTGAGVAIIGALLALGTLVVMTVESHKVHVFASVLGDLNAEGQSLYADRSSDKAAISAWGDRAVGIIESALGPAEAALFVSNSGYVFYSGRSDQPRLWLDGRLRRLAELIARLDSVHVNLRFRVPPEISPDGGID